MKGDEEEIKLHTKKEYIIQNTATKDVTQIYTDLKRAQYESIKIVILSSFIIDFVCRILFLFMYLFMFNSAQRPACSLYTSISMTFT